MFDLCRNLTYSLTHKIGSAIIRGSYSIDKHFPTEAELSLEFNISRNVTREAIKMLTAKGLLEQRPRRGISVTPAEYWNMFDHDVLAWTLNANPELKLLREFTQLRIAIEPEAARLAAENYNEKAVMEPIEKALKNMDQSCKVYSSNEFLAAEIEFHKAILSASKNSYFLQMRQFIQIALQANIANVSANQLMCSGSAIEIYLRYKKISHEINIGNGVVAAKLVRELLNISMALIDEHLKVAGNASS